MSASALIGRQIRLRREQRGMSLATLARRAKIGKATLSGIEAGRGNPTIETLDAVAAALTLPLADLLVPAADAAPIVTRATEWSTEGPQREVLHRLPGSFGLESWRLRMRAGDAFDGVPHATGTVEMLFVASGELVAGPADDQVELGPGDHLVFPGDQPHRYATTSGADVHVVIATDPSPHRAGPSRGAPTASTVNTNAVVDGTFPL